MGDIEVTKAIGFEADSAGYTIMVRTQHITHYYRSPSKSFPHTTIVLVNGESIAVQELPVDIMRLIDVAEQEHGEFINP